MLFVARCLSKLSSGPLYSGSVGFRMVLLIHLVPFHIYFYDSLLQIRLTAKASRFV